MTFEAWRLPPYGSVYEDHLRRVGVPIDQGGHLRRAGVTLHSTSRPLGRLTVSFSLNAREIIWRLPRPDMHPFVKPATDREMRMADLMILGGDRDAASPRIRGIADERSGVIRDGDAIVGLSTHQIPGYAGGYDAARARRMGEPPEESATSGNAPPGESLPGLQDVRR